ncbi:MAG: DUF2752 domain-containing protein [Bacteroidales bacterium]|nr:DUF2752 domain-containing protein [Bacteroidales bacterium]
MLPCPLYTFTHLQCPFCGIQRGLLALAHGDIVAWWNYNPVVWCLIPYFLVLVIGEAYRPLQSRSWVRFCYSNKVIFTVMGILLLWGVIRNLITYNYI